MKVTVALGWGDRAVVSPHIGELSSPRGMAVFRQLIADLQALYGVTAERVVADAHPGYGSSRWARGSGLPVLSVLHHHAHASALAGEHAVDEAMLVFAWDGVGLGGDGTLWGGEGLYGRPGAWRRVSSFRPFRLPGGEKAGREPWRSALALCWEAGMDWPAGARLERRPPAPRLGEGVERARDQRRRPAVRRGRGAAGAGRARKLRGPRADVAGGRKSRGRRPHRASARARGRRDLALRLGAAAAGPSRRRRRHGRARRDLSRQPGRGAARPGPAGPRRDRRRDGRVDRRGVPEPAARGNRRPPARGRRLPGADGGAGSRQRRRLELRPAGRGGVPGCASDQPSRRRTRGSASPTATAAGSCAS